MKTADLHPKRVLIAHQSTIPHYRIPFYRALERLRPEYWRFAVVYDSDLEGRGRLSGEPLDEEELAFPLERVRTLSVPGTRGKLRYQTFLRRAGRYDLLVLEDAFNNLAYPLARMQLRRGVRIAYWGHGRDRSLSTPKGWKKLTERLKLRWARGSSGFFAYTAGVRDFLIRNGVPRNKIFVLDNTIDTEAHRRVFDEMRGRRDELRRERGWQERIVLLYVGRMSRRKRLGFLAETVDHLRRRDPAYLLALVGGGGETLLEMMREKLGDEGVEHLGVATEPRELAPLFIAADAYVLPGWVGLGPLTALCYDLTPVIVESDHHAPEVEYLTAANSVTAPARVSPAEYAEAIAALVEDPARRERYRQAAWPSIRHLTIDNMARNFIRGVDHILGTGTPARPVEKEASEIRPAGGDL